MIISNISTSLILKEKNPDICLNRSMKTTNLRNQLVWSLVLAVDNQFLESFVNVFVPNNALLRIFYFRKRKSSGCFSFKLKIPNKLNPQTKVWKAKYLKVHFVNFIRFNSEMKGKVFETKPYIAVNYTI